MRTPRHVHASDIRGLAQLATDGVVSTTDLVEAVHAAISRSLRFRDSTPPDRTSGITGIVYRSIRGVNVTVASALDKILGQLESAVSPAESSAGREAVMAILNGVLGDSLAACENPLAIPMSIRRQGNALVLTGEGLAGVLRRPTDRVVVFVHGLCMNDLQWRFGRRCEAGHGFTPVFLHYNTGLHISVNGRGLAEVLEKLEASWPRNIREIAIVAHSMGGLVARAAVLYGQAAGFVWPKRLRKLIFLGTPHHGAPLERGGNWFGHLLGSTPYSAPFARIGKMRSAGITDLRYGNLCDEDWQGRDRFEPGPDPRRNVPLPPGVQCSTVAATIGEQADGLKPRAVGDGLVPVDSALGRHSDPQRCLSFPKEGTWVASGVGHLGLVSRPEVGAWVARRLSAG